jgi:hypothetical protein
MQVFSNNASTTLAAELSAVATSMTVTASTGFAALTSPQFELVTLEEGSTREVVKVTARSGNTWTIVRAQEGTSAALWAEGSSVEARTTAGTLAGMVQREVPEVATGEGATAAGVQGAAYGFGATADEDYAVAVGSNASAALVATAVGPSSNADENAVAIGYNATAQNTSALALGSGSEAYGYNSCSINGLVAFADLSIITKGYCAIPEDDLNDQYEHWSAGTLAVFATPYFDLAVPPDWQASTAYPHGKIVQPTTGGTVQYRVWSYSEDAPFTHLIPTSDATEPTWPGSGGSVNINSTDDTLWVGTDLSAGYETETFPDWLEFWPTSIAFLCHEYASTTGTPTVSIGTPSAPTLILDTANVGITAAGQIFQFDLPNPCPRIPEGESILVTLEGAASAGVMAGRFLFSGAFVATRSRA